MKTQSLALQTARPVTPPPRSTRSYLVDAVALAGFVLAIGVSAMFLDVPYAWLVAAIIAFVSLVIINPKGTKPLAERPGTSTQP